MKKAIAPVLIFLLHAGLNTAHGADERPLKVFVLAGTSNMLGAAAKVENLPDDLKEPLKDVLAVQQGEWKPIQPGKNLVGNEATFGQAMSKNLGEPIGIVWISAASSADKPQTSGLKNMVKLWHEKGRPVVIAGMLVDVSYRDGNKEEAAMAYRESMIRWIETARSELGNDQLPIVMNRGILPERGEPYLELIRQAQDTIKLPAFKVFNCDDVTKGTDKVHFNTAGRLEMGKRFAAAMIELLKAEK